MTHSVATSMVNEETINCNAIYFMSGGDGIFLYGDDPALYS